MPTLTLYDTLDAAVDWIAQCDPASPLPLWWADTGRKDLMVPVDRAATVDELVGILHMAQQARDTETATYLVTRILVEIKEVPG